MVCEALSEKQEARLKQLMASKRGGFMVVKRAFDETPFYVKDSDGTRVPIKVLNRHQLAACTLAGGLAVIEHSVPRTQRSLWTRPSLGVSNIKQGR